jgi:helicase
VRASPAGLRVMRCNGYASDGVGPVMSGRYDLAFFTYEMFLNLALVSARLLNHLRLSLTKACSLPTPPVATLSSDFCVVASGSRARR